jgi:lipoate-protein ligase A
LYIDKQVLSKLDAEHSYTFYLYEPDRIEIVLGRSCQAEEDVKITRCKKDGVPILRRAGGGGTVVLCPGVVVVSVAGISKTPFALKEHMAAVNEAIISALEELGVTGLAVIGISDIAIGNRKILGASLHRRRDTVLYQGSLLVDPEVSIFDRYLKHPNKEPDYRAGRTHREFLSSLAGSGYSISVETVIEMIEDKLHNGPPWKVL